MPEKMFTMCHGCGAQAPGKHDLCPTCGSAHVRIQDVSWLHGEETKGSDYFPAKEEQG